MGRVAPLRQGEGEQLARRPLVRVQREVAAGVVGVRGSSPRVRGTPNASPSAPCPRRFIPACAGNSPEQPEEREFVHGSSPRVRGTRGVRVLGEAGRRFIPACAGNSRPARGSSGSGSVHPRVCGELSAAAPMSDNLAGSSPRVRGTPGTIYAPEGGLRFIPACAGNSRQNADAPTSASVHPRVCGELVLEGKQPRLRRGSSPRVRGTRSGAWPRRASSSVHPRVCGELVAKLHGPRAAVGSSPRVRGTRDED